jgi:hypothetical protein
MCLAPVSVADSTPSVACEPLRRVSAMLLTPRLRTCASGDQVPLLMLAEAALIATAG